MEESPDKQLQNFIDIADLQDELLSLDFQNESELNTFKQQLISSPLLNSKWTFRSILVSIYTCYLCRQHSNFNYIDLFIEIAKLPQNVFNSDFYVLSFTNKFFIYQLFKAGLVATDSLYEQSTNTEEYCIYFYPEIKEYYSDSPSLANKYLLQLKECVESSGYHITDTDDKPYFDKFIELRSEGKNPDPILLSIRMDDVEHFQQLLSQTNTPVDKLVQRSIFERFIFINESNKESLPTLIEFAAFFGSIKCFKFLYQKVPDLPNTIANFAVAGGNYEIIHLCEQKHAIFGNESLMISIRFFQSDLSSYLEEFCNLEKTIDDVSKSIVYYNLRSLILYQEVLRDDPNKLDSRGYTMLSLASLNGDLDIINYLIATFGDQIDVNKKSQYGNSPFYYAAGNGHYEIVKYLSSLPNVDINAKNSDDLTALHYAAKRGHLKVVKFLCGLPNIDVNADCNRNEYPIDLAVENGHTEIIKFLAQLPNVIVYDFKAENSIIEHSVLSGRIDIVKLVFELVDAALDKLGVEDKEKFMSEDEKFCYHKGYAYALARYSKMNDIADFIKSFF